MTNNLPVISMNDVVTMANVVCKSGLFGVKDPNQAMALMLLCQAEGLHPMVACRQYHVIQGRAAMTSQTMMSKFLAGGGKQEIHSATETEADITLSHPAGGSMRVKWTIEQAQKAGLTGKDNWKNHPRSMLLRRAQAEAVRAVAPFVLEGVPTADEAEELEPPNPMHALRPDVVIEPPRPVYQEFVLDKTWDRETKARVARKVTELKGLVDKSGTARIPEESVQAFDEYLASVIRSQDPTEDEIAHAVEHFQA